VRTERGFERLITFADAVVAIALTLLVLPLSEIASELSKDTSVGDVFSQNRSAFGSFALSFVVIWVLWNAHHRMMEYFDAYDGVLFPLTMVWLLTIVLLPFVTQLITGNQYDRGAPALYEAVLLLSSLCLAGMSWWGRRHPELLAEGPEADRWRTEPMPIGVPTVLVISLLLTLVFPSIGAYPLFLLLAADNVIDRARLRRWRRRQPG